MINFPWIVPTIDEPMSAYTALAIIFMVSLGTVVVIIGYYWMKREIGGIHRIIKAHDGFVEKTSKDISKIQTNVAVLVEKCDGSKEDMTEIKESITGINHTLLEISKK